VHNYGKFEYLGEFLKKWKSLEIRILWPS
jgi:hypothetical protein